jgi:hypothetical protein
LKIGCSTPAPNDQALEEALNKSELGAFQAQQPGKADIGKIRRLRHADVGIGGD